MAGADNPEINPYDKDFVRPEDPSWAELTGVPGYGPSPPLTPSDLKKPEVLKEQVDGLKLAAGIALGSLVLPEVGIVGVAGKLLRTVRGAIGLARAEEAVEGKVTDETQPAVPPKMPEAQKSTSGAPIDNAPTQTGSDVTVARLSASHDDATEVARKMRELTEPEEIRRFVRLQFAQKGPKALDTIDSVLSTPEELEGSGTSGIPSFD